MPETDTLDAYRARREEPPPYDEESEVGLIGSTLLDSTRLFSGPTAAKFEAVPVAAFYTPGHMLIWQAVLSLHATAAPINILTLAAELRRVNELDRAGGTAYLDSCVDRTPTSAHAEYYADQVLRAYRRRQILEALGRVDLAVRTDGDVAEAVRTLSATAAPPASGIVLENAFVYLRDDPPPHNPIFIDLIDRGDKGGIIAKAKTRKTFFAMQMAICAASGRDFLGFRPPRQLSVLYCNYEIRAHHAWRRLHRLGRALSVAPEDIGDRLQIYNMRGPPVPLDAVTRKVEEMRADVVILDPLYKVVQDGDENKAEDLKPYLAEFDALCERTGACLWYVHHDTKGQAGDRDARDRGSGSSVLNRDFDACITLTDHVDGDDMLVMHALPRNYAPPQDVTIRWDNGAFFASDIAPEAMTSQKQQSPYKEKVRKYKRDHPEASTRDVAKAIGCSQTVARKWWDIEDGEGL